MGFPMVFPLKPPFTGCFMARADLNCTTPWPGSAIEDVQLHWLPLRLDKDTPGFTRELCNMCTYVYISIYIYTNINIVYIYIYIYLIYILYIYIHHKSNPSSTFSTTLGPWLLFTPKLPKKRPEGSLRISKMVRNWGMASKNAMASEAPKMILRQETFRKYFLQKK